VSCLDGRSATGTTLGGLWSTVHTLVALYRCKVTAWEGYMELPTKDTRGCELVYGYVASASKRLSQWMVAYKARSATPF
jgi:hypothetical protein